MILVKSPDPIVFGPNRPILDFDTREFPYWNEYIDFLLLRDEYFRTYAHTRTSDLFEVKDS